MKSRLSSIKGFTLVETVVGVAIFLVVATAVYGAYISLFNIINLNQYRIVALNLVNEQMEIVKNLPYSDIGIVNGIPNGKIPNVQTLTRSGITFTVTTTIKNVDLPYDGAMGSSTMPDTSPADNKMVEVEVSCMNCKNFTPIKTTTTVAPKGLETSTTNGSILIKVFDAAGMPVTNAQVHIFNKKITPFIIIDELTDSNGYLLITDVPPGTNAYQITVTKSGYSTDRTYTPSASNPYPIKPDLTVIAQQLSAVSFSIDRLSDLTYYTVDSFCTPIPHVYFNSTGAKMIGADMPKYSWGLATDVTGRLAVKKIEWDSYTISPMDSVYDIAGLNPLNPVLLNPGSSQSSFLIMSPKRPNSVMVTVKDSATRLPVTDAQVDLSYNDTDHIIKTTGRGFMSQTDWSGGSGQATGTNMTRYYSDDGNIDVSKSAGDIMLKKVFGSYNSSGWLESSTIDTGSVSNFYNLSWSPNVQSSQTGTSSVKMQFASSTTTPAVWDFRGPDGTSNTYYTSPDMPISEIHNGDRYVRYKVFLSTISSSHTPSVSDVSFTVTSSCTPPGQVLFNNLLSNKTYDINVTKNGYSSYSTTIKPIDPWQEIEVVISPS